MKRGFLILSTVAVIGAAGAGGWYVLRSRDPLAQVRMLMQHGDLRSAQLALRDLVRRQPELADAHLRLGLTELRLGDPIAAERELRDAASRGADEHAVRPLLAQALALQGKNEVVLRDYSADGLDATQAADLHIGRAIAALQLKQNDAALAEAASAQKAAPQSAEAALIAARVAHAVGDLDAARRHVDEALAIAPHTYAALVLRAQLLDEQHDTAGAIAAYDAALSDSAAAGANTTEARFARASLHMGLNQDAAARADVDAMLKADARNPFANYQLAALEARASEWKQADGAIALAQPVLARFDRADLLLALIKENVGEPAQAVEAAEHFHAVHPADVAGVRTLAQIYLRNGHAKEAVALLEAWRAAGHQDTDLLAQLSQAYALDGQSAKADAVLRQAGDKVGSDPAGLSRVAGVALQMGDAGLAAEQLQAALTLHDPVMLADASNTTAPSSPSPALSQENRADAAAALVVSLLRSGQVDRAASALDQLRAAHGDPQQIDVLTGAVKTAQFDLTGARAAFESAHARDPASASALVDVARVMSLQGDTAGAAKLLRDRLDKDPANAAVVNAYVELSLARGAPADAIAAEEAAHKAAPTDAAIASGLAALYLRTGHADQALSMIGSLPQDAPQTLGMRADAERALGHMDEAITAWQALLAKQPLDLALRRRIISFLIAAKRYDTAQPILEDGLSRYPNNPGLQADQVMMTVGRDGFDAGLARADALAAQATSMPGVALKADLLVNAKRFSDAATAYGEARGRLGKDAKPDEASALVVRQIGALNAAGETDAGRKLMHDWLAAHPDDPLVEEAMAETLLSGGDLKGAREALTSVLTHQPGNPAALNNLAWTDQQLGDLEGAMENARLAYRIAPSPQTADTLGWILASEKRPGDALVLLREAAAGQPGDASIQYHLAASLKDNGQDQAARDVLTPLLRNDATFRERPQAETLMQSLVKP